MPNTAERCANVAAPSSDDAAVSSSSTDEEPHPAVADLPSSDATRSVAAAVGEVAVASSSTAEDSGSVRRRHHSQPDREGSGTAVLDGVPIVSDSTASTANPPKTDSKTAEAPTDNEASATDGMGDSDDIVPSSGVGEGSGSSRRHRVKSTTSQNSSSARQVRRSSNSKDDDSPTQKSGGAKAKPES